MEGEKWLSRPHSQQPHASATQSGGKESERGSEQGSKSLEEGERSTWWEGRDSKEDVCENVVDAGEYSRVIFPRVLDVVRLKACK